MAVGTSAMCGTFKREILAGIHFWTAHSRGDSSAISADTFTTRIDVLYGYKTVRPELACRIQMN